MSTQNLFNILVAGAIALPAIISTYDIANAQSFVSRQTIINGLQIHNSNKRRVVRQRSRRRSPQGQIGQAAHGQNGQFRNQRRVAKRRAPAPNNQVSFRRAPAPNNNRQMLRAPGPVARSRAPGANNNPQHFRAPDQQNFGNQRSRAPERVAVRRAPSRNTQRSRAPSRAPNNVSRNRAPNRTPNRAPQRFDTQVASASGQINSRAIRIEERTPPTANGPSVDLEILFEYNSADISPKSLRQLLTLGEALQAAELNNSRIMIAGHTDASGSNGYNINLSYRRAQSVSDFLSNYAGISGNRLAIEGYGEELLKYPDAPNSGQNRRVEIINLGS